ncbi:hypothetical protein GGI25_005598, partial [Coemansia spiralis]
MVDTRIESVLTKTPNKDFWPRVWAHSTTRMITHIPDLFALRPDGRIAVWVAGPKQWSKSISNEVEREQDPARDTPEQPLIDLAHVRRVLSLVTHQPEPLLNGRQMAAGKWAHTASTEERTHRTPLLEGPQHARPFTRKELKSLISEEEHRRMRQAEEVTVYTDGSFINDADRLSLSFAAVFEFQVDSKELEQVCVKGRTADGPFSSTTAELMAIAAAMAIAPRDCK